MKNKFAELEFKLAASDLASFMQANPVIAYDDEKKKKFKSLGQKWLKELAGKMGFKESKVSFNPGGIAVSGDHSLMGMWDDTNGVHMFFNLDGFGNSATYRSIKSMKDYSGGPNKQIPFHALSDMHHVMGMLNSVKSKTAEKGPRGGNIIGKTRSGKPIYDTFDHPSHKEFNKHDHADAMLAHNSKSNDFDKSNDPDNKQWSYHIGEGKKHMNKVSSNFEDYKKKHPGTKKTPSDEMFKDLEENAGYNPQKVHEYGHKVVKDHGHSLVTKGDDGEHKVWSKTDAKDQHDLIKKHPKTVSLEHNGKFYVD